jgi:hypothetical protein
MSMIDGNTSFRYNRDRTFYLQDDRIIDCCKGREKTSIPLPEYATGARRAIPNFYKVWLFLLPHTLSKRVEKRICQMREKSRPK